MGMLEQLGHLIDAEQDRLRRSIPHNREAALLAIMRARDALPLRPVDTGAPDLMTGWRLTDPGGNVALRLVLEDQQPTGPPSDIPPGWPSQFLTQCAHLAEATILLGHLETGFMRMAAGSAGQIDAWVSTRRPPASWRERADATWWTSWLLDCHAPDIFTLTQATTGDPAQLERIAGGVIAAMEHQSGYPADTRIGDFSLPLAVRTVGQLIRLALDGDGGEVWEDIRLTATVAQALGADQSCVSETLEALTLDEENAAWHSIVPGIAAAPMVRIDRERRVISRYGLTTEPLLFLTRELRRRAPDTYHNAASAREAVFREDLYALFTDKRFVTSPGRIRLRHPDGKIRTDIDAAIFDRKTGTLGIFELKSQDPYARSTAALQRQRDNLLYANRQVSGVLDWIKRHGANEILARIDTRTARTFRVQRVYPFVLGRYLARFDDGPAPDKRATWGTWPGVLRVMENTPIRATDANPIASLFTRLSQDEPPLPSIDDMPQREIRIGSTCIMVHRSWAAYQAAVSE
jgi:hypothetical protein